MADDTVVHADDANEGAHPETITSLSAREALERLKSGNAAYLDAQTNHGNISAELIDRLFQEGQAPFACVISCSDSRVVPEHIFMTGLGELFCIRVAGNAVGDLELASALYAAEHLRTPLILVLGHTHCGAIEAAWEVADNKVPAEGDAIAPLAWRVIAGVGDERDPLAAATSNVRFGMETLLADPDIAHLVAEGALEVAGAIYHTHSGEVDFLD